MLLGIPMISAVISAGVTYCYVWRWPGSCVYERPEDARICIVRDVLHCQCMSMRETLQCLGAESHSRCSVPRKRFSASVRSDSWTGVPRPSVILYQDVDPRLAARAMDVNRRTTP